MTMSQIPVPDVARDLAGVSALHSLFGAVKREAGRGEGVTRVKRHPKLIPLRHGNLIPFPRAIQSGLATATAQGEVLAAYSATLPRSQRLRLERP